jgi:hypothetical protein
MTDAYMCPFCRSAKSCIGPHVSEKDLPNFLNVVREERWQALGRARDAVLMLPVVDGNLRRTDVVYAIWNVS